MFESIVCFGLQILIGQVLLVGWLPNSIGLFTQTYWLFLFVFWAAYRLGWQGVAFVIVIAGVQAFYGGLHGVGVFGNDFVQTYGLKTVIFLLSLLLAGLGFNSILNHYNHVQSELRKVFEAVNSNSNPIILLDNQQKFYYVNPAFEALLGYSLAEIKGQTTDLILPEIDDIPVNRILNEEVLQSKEGLLIPVKIDFAPIKDKRNRPIGMVCNLTDVTEIRKILKAESESKAQWLSLFNHMSNAFSLHQVIRDDDDRVVDYTFLEVNPAFEKMTGLAKELFIGKKASDVLPKWEHHLIDHFATVINTGKSHHTDTYDKRSKRWYSLYAYSPANEQFAVISVDITQRKLMEDSLRKSEERFKLLFNAIPDPLFLTRCTDGQFLDVNRMACETLGYTQSELLTKGPADIDSPEFQDKVAERVTALQTYGKLIFESAHITKMGDVIPVEINSQIIHLDDQPVLLSLARDCRERKQAEQTLRLAASVFAHARESVIITDSSGNIINVNEAFSQCTGYTREEVLGKNPRILSSGHQNSEFYQELWQSIQRTGTWKGEVWNRTKSGEIYAALLNIVAVKDKQDNVTHFISLAIEITHIREYQKSLEYMAQHDVLTGLPNRLLLIDRLHQAIESSKRNQLMLAVCYLDLDGFKPINDKLGHKAGDRVLVEIAKRLSETVRQMDTVARLGGDEFVVLLLAQEQENAFLPLINRLLAIISAPILIDQHTCSVSASIGISVFPQHAQDSDTLLAHADAAMYRAKRQGKNRYALWQSTTTKATD